MPPGTLPTLWHDDERYVASYLSAYPGYYLTGDGGYVDEDGYVFVMGRTDDVLNVAGHRLSTGSLEAALAGHPAVAECAVIGVYDELKGQVPRGLVVLKAGVEADPETAAGRAGAAGARRGRRGGLAAPGRHRARPCPRRARARSCARRCGSWPTARTPSCPSTIEDAGVLTLSDQSCGLDHLHQRTATIARRKVTAIDAQAVDRVRDPRALPPGSSAAGTLRPWPKRLRAPVAELQRTWRGRSRSPRSPSST